MSGIGKKILQERQTGILDFKALANYGYKQLQLCAIYGQKVTTTVIYIMYYIIYFNSDFS